MHKRKHAQHCESLSRDMLCYYLRLLLPSVHVYCWHHYILKREKRYVATLLDFWSVEFSEKPRIYLRQSSWGPYIVHVCAEGRSECINIYGGTIYAPHTLVKVSLEPKYATYRLVFKIIKHSSTYNIRERVFGLWIRWPDGYTIIVPVFRVIYDYNINKYYLYLMPHVRNIESMYRKICIQERL